MVSIVKMLSLLRQLVLWLWVETLFWMISYEERAKTLCSNQTWNYFEHLKKNAYFYIHQTKEEVQTELQHSNDLSSGAMSTTEPVRSCNLIRHDRPDSLSYTRVKAYTNKYHDMCWILALSLSLSISNVPLLFPSTCTNTVLEPPDTFRQMLQHSVISALFCPHSLSLVCRNFQNVVLLFLCVSQACKQTRTTAEIRE